MTTESWELEFWSKYAWLSNLTYRNTNPKAMVDFIRQVEAQAYERGKKDGVAAGWESKDEVIADYKQKLVEKIQNLSWYRNIPGLSELKSDVDYIKVSDLLNKLKQ